MKTPDPGTYKLMVLLILIFWALHPVAQTPDKHDKLVDSFNRTRQSEKLIPYFEKELKANPKSESVLRWLGYLYIADNQPDIGEKYYRDALLVNPKCARCYMHIARAYAMKTENVKALELFDRSISTDPNDALLYATRAKFKARIGDQGGALADHNKAIGLDPKNSSYYIERGQYQLSQGSFSLALFDLNKAVQLAPDSYYPYLQRAGIYYDQRMMKEAMADINTAIQLDSNQEALYNGRGALYAVFKEHEKAIADYTKAIVLNPKGPVAWYNRAMEKYALEDMDGSCSDMEACYAAIKKYEPNNSLKSEIEALMDNYCDTTRPSYYYQRGIAFYNLGQFDKSIAIYTTGVKKFPTNSMLLSFRGNAHFAVKDYLKALPDYYASIQNKDNLVNDIAANKVRTGINSDSMGAYAKVFVADMQVSIAKAKFAMGQYEEALTAVTQGIDNTPDGGSWPKENYYNVRGNVFLALGKHLQAIDDFDKCIQLNPLFPIAYVNRAIAKMNQSNQVKMISWSIRGGGGIGSQAFNANWTMPLKSSVKQSDAAISSALSDCNKALDMDPKLDIGWYIRGQIKQKLMYADYCFDLKKARDLGYPVEAELLQGCGK
jgi:tetratricopeptide (TPR) repeat protein